jgi:hypothetical protein
MEASAAEKDGTSATRPQVSYKFQRLREKLREAIATGELQGKLPGERTLATRFHVNAKTISKALTDLAAEGVLDRSIGRGTYVKGSEPALETRRWLVVHEHGEPGSCILQHLQRLDRNIQTVPALQPLRPSFLNQFSAVIDLSFATSDDAVRNLLVRNMPVVMVNRLPTAYSVNAVVVDAAMGVTRLARDLLLAGHRHLGAIEPTESQLVSQNLRRAMERFRPDAEIETGNASQAAMLVENGVTALVCGSVDDARTAMRKLKEHGIPVPGRVCVTAVGCTCPEAQCSGYFVDCAKLAEAAAKLLTEPPARPVTLWLSGQWIDRGTLAPSQGHLTLEHAANLRISGVTV